MWREKCRRTQETTAPMIAGVVWCRVLRGYGCGGCGERARLASRLVLVCKVCWLWNEVQTHGSALAL
jgi:hypothetical protein